MIRHLQSTWTLWNKLRLAGPLPEFILLSPTMSPYCPRALEWDSRRLERKPRRHASLLPMTEGPASFTPQRRSKPVDPRKPQGKERMVSGAAPEKDQSSEEVTRPKPHKHSLMLWLHKTHRSFHLFPWRHLWFSSSISRDKETKLAFTFPRYNQAPRAPAAPCGLPHSPS